MKKDAKTPTTTPESRDRNTTIAREAWNFHMKRETDTGCEFCVENIATRITTQTIKTRKRIPPPVRLCHGGLCRLGAIILPYGFPYPVKDIGQSGNHPVPA
jgi:hypothetical protein